MVVSKAEELWVNEGDDVRKLEEYCSYIADTKKAFCKDWDVEDREVSMYHLTTMGTT